MSTNQHGRLGAIACSVVVILMLTVTGCGGDDDTGGGDKTQPAGQEAPDAAAAQRLEAYLRKNAKDVKGSHGSGEVISHVEPADGNLKVWSFLNAELATDDAPARKVCRVASESGVPEAKGALLVDAGDALLRRC